MCEYMFCVAGDLFRPGEGVQISIEWEPGWAPEKVRTLWRREKMFTARNQTLNFSRRSHNTVTAPAALVCVSLSFISVAFPHVV